MKQPNDGKTIELPLESPKRGRGRPAKVDALTPAERAKRYRDAKRGTTAPTIKRDATVTENIEGIVSPSEYMRIKRMCWSLENQLDPLRTQLQLAEAERDAAMMENEKLKRQLENAERDAHNAQHVSMVESDCREHADERMYELQKKFDLEHLKLVNALNQMAELEHAATKPPKINPLAAEVRKLKAELKKRDDEHKKYVTILRSEFMAETQKTSKNH